MIMGLFTIYAFVAKFPTQQRNPAWDLPAESTAPEQSRIVLPCLPSSLAT
jgi:hypothetical protein